MKWISRRLQLKDEWDRVVHHSDDAWFFHLYDWLELSQAHWPLEDRSFLAEHEGKIVGVLPLQINKHSKSLKSTYMGMGGPALVNGLQEGVRRKILKAMHEQARLIALQARSPFIEMLISPLTPGCLQDRWQVNPLLAHAYDDASTHAWMVDLGPDIDHIVAQFSDDARRSIVLAGQKGYKIQRLSDISGIEALYEVHCINRKRTGAPAHPKDFFLGVYRYFCAQNSAVIWQAIDAQGRLAAFQVTTVFKNGAYYWMGSSRDEDLESGVNYLLQDHAIRWAKAQGLAWYDNGEAFQASHGGKEYGLSMFKGKFGGRLHRFFRGKFIFNHPGPVRRLGLNLLKSFFQRQAC